MLWVQEMPTEDDMPHGAGGLHIVADPAVTASKDLQDMGRTLLQAIACS